MKKLLGVAVAAFALFYLFTEPKHSADIVKSAVVLVGDAFDAIVAFLTALFS